MVTHAHVVLFLFADIVEKALPIITGSLQVSQTSCCLFCPNPFRSVLREQSIREVDSKYVVCMPSDVKMKACRFVLSFL